MNCEAVRKNIEAFALGALEEPEADAVAAHIAECAECAELASAYQSTVDHLPLAVPLRRAPARLRKAVLAGARSPGRPAPPLLRDVRVLSAAAAVLVALAVGGVVWAAILSFQVNDLRAESQRLGRLVEAGAESAGELGRLQSALGVAEDEQRRMATRLEEQSKIIALVLDPDALPSDLQGTSLAPEAHCYYLWSAYQSIGGLLCQDLPPAGPAGTYQMWMTKDGTTIAVGSLTAQPDGSATAVVRLSANAPPGPVTDMWVTRESGRAVPSKPGSDVVLARAPAEQTAR